MNVVVRESADNTSDIVDLNEYKNNQPNLKLITVKQEAPEPDDVQLESFPYEVRTIKSETVATDDKFESTSETNVISNQSLEQKSDTLDQECEVERDKTSSIKEEELLHEELDIKSEDEVVQELGLEDNYTLANQFWKHMRLPSEVKPFKCKICDYRCTQSSILKIHLRTHTEEKPFKCNICDYCCRHKCGLSYHLKTHTGIKPLKCNICDFSFRSKQILKIHLRTHTGDKPFKCNSCDYSCGQKVQLQNHLGTHTGEKPNVIFVIKNILRKNFIIHCKKTVSTVTKPADKALLEKSYGNSQ